MSRDLIHSFWQHPSRGAEKGYGYSERILTPIFEIEENVVKRIGEKTIQELGGAATEFSNVMEQKIEKQENTW